MSIPLAELEDLVDGSGIAPEIEVLLPAGVRHRQLAVRTLILGMPVQVDPDDLPAVIRCIHQWASFAWWRRMLCTFQHPPGAEARS